MSKKPLIFALLAVALAGGGTAFYLLKYKPDQDRAARIAAAQLIIEDETPAAKSTPAKSDPATPEVKPETPAPAPAPAPTVAKAEPPIFVKPEPKTPSEPPHATAATDPANTPAAPATPAVATAEAPKKPAAGEEVSPAVKTTADGKPVLAFPETKSATASTTPPAETKEPAAGTAPASTNPPATVAPTPQPVVAEAKDQAPRSASSPIRKIGLDGKPLVAIPDPRGAVNSTTVSPLRKVGADGKPVVSLPDPRELNKPKEPATQP